MAHHGPEQRQRQNRRQEQLPLLLGDGLLAVTFLIKRLLFGNGLIPKLLHALLNIAKAYLGGIEFYPGRLQCKIDVGLINTWHPANHFLDFRSTGSTVHANQLQVHRFLCCSVTQLFDFLFHLLDGNHIRIKCNRRFSSAKFTFASWTPSILLRPFSIRFAQAAHVIPVNCSDVFFCSIVASAPIFSSPSSSSCRLVKLRYILVPR